MVCGVIGSALLILLLLFFPPLFSLFLLFFIFIYLYFYFFSLFIFLSLHKFRASVSDPRGLRDGIRDGRGDGRDGRDGRGDPRGSMSFTRPDSSIDFDMAGSEMDGGGYYRGGGPGAPKVTMSP